MNRHFFAVAFFLGAAAVAWVGIGFGTTNLLALLMTVIIAGVYSGGAWELLQFRRATDTLTHALANIPSNLLRLEDWLAQLHPSLQNAVRSRVEGERTGLPGPTLTPYLVGLLVMLGMLGTFLGMVVTLNGAVFALEGTTDLQAIRSSLAAPIKGLGLAFGTSLAGVASSAMLGLISALVRRERLQAGQLLDTKIASILRGFSLTHQRQETFKALQLQSQALPGVVDQLQAMMTLMERQSQQLNERLLSSQENFHSHIQGVYTGLAHSVDQSLKDSLTTSARVAADTIKPLADATMAGMAREATLLHERLLTATQTHLDALSTQSGTNATAIAQSWTAALAQQEGSNRTMLSRVDQSLQTFSDTFAQRSEQLVTSVSESLAVSQANQAVGHQQQLATWTQALESIATTLQNEWQHAGERALGQQQEICVTLERTARQITEQAQANTDHTLADITRLLDTAAEAPRAAAEVIGQLRQELSSSMARDNAMLEERSRILETLSALLDSIQHASGEQRSTIDALVSSSTELLSRVSTQFADKVAADSARLSDSAAHVNSSAVEVASLGEAFGFAVQLFNDSNEKLISNLQRIEAAMDKSMARSDDQLAYYVAQAREIMDLSIMSQKDVIDDLRTMRSQQAALVDEVN